MSGLTKPGPTHQTLPTRLTCSMTHTQASTRKTHKALLKGTEEGGRPLGERHISSCFWKENSAVSGQSCWEWSYRRVCAHSPSLHISISYHPHASFTTGFIIPSSFPTSLPCSTSMRGIEAPSSPKSSIGSSDTLPPKALLTL